MHSNGSILLIVTLRGHKKRIDVIKFHPSAGNVLASASFDKSIKLWDASVETEKLSYDFPDSVFSIDWNYNGSLLAVMGKDKKIRIFDPRASSIAQVRLPPPPPNQGLTQQYSFSRKELLMRESSRATLCGWEMPIGWHQQDSPR